MPRKAPAIAGFDYVKGCAVAMVASEWQATYRECNRRVENGETFYSVKRGKIRAEAYANIPPAPGQQTV